MRVLKPRISSCERTSDRPKQKRASLLDILDDDDGGACGRAPAAAETLPALVPICSSRNAPAAPHAVTSGAPLITSVAEFYDQVRVLVVF